MLTDLGFLNVGQPWLPEDADTRERFDRYSTNLKLFEGEQAEVYEEKFKRISRVIGNFDEIISYPTIINYQKLMSLKIADLLFGEEPFIETENKENLKDLFEEIEFFNKMYEMTLDISRFGDGIASLHVDEEQGATISIGNPCMWIPVVDVYNCKKIVNHVIAWQYNENGNNFLKVHIHFKGSYIDRLYKLTDSIKDNIKMYSSNSRYFLGSIIEETAVQTGLTDFAIIHTPNITTSNRLTGYDDYMDVDSVISEILVRISQIERVLDKHADPSMEGSMASAEKDPASGEWKIKMGGKFFMRDSKDDAETRYITWDGQLESSFKSVELLLNQLYIISELGSVLLGGDIEGGGQTSGRALRMRMISPLAKVKRLTKRLTPNIKKMIDGLAELRKMTIGKISIVWQDGLPNDPLEEAEIIASRTGNKATMSQKRAIMQYDNLSEEDAEEELAMIVDEEQMYNPIKSEVEVDTEDDNRPEEEEEDGED